MKIIYKDTLEFHLGKALSSRADVHWAIDEHFRLAKSANDKEDQLIGSASPAVKRQFHSGRAVARLALTSACGDADIARLPILRDKHGAPLWPPGMIGSISHCKNCAIAIAAHQGAHHRFNMGIDIENYGRVDKSLYEIILTPRERLSAAARGDLTHWAQIVFSVKEAFYKAVYPSLGRVLDFSDAEVVPLGEPASPEGELKILPSPHITNQITGFFSGLWVCHGQYVLTYVEHNKNTS